MLSLPESFLPRLAFGNPRPQKPGGKSGARKLGGSLGKGRLTFGGKR